MDNITWEKLKKTCNYPWTQDEPDKIANAVTKLCMDQERYINDWGWRWYQNMQFVFGNHFVKWSRHYGFAVDSDFLTGKKKAINSRSYTNISSTVAESLAAAIYFGLPDWEVLSMDDSSSRCSRYQKISQKLLDAHLELMEMQDEFRAAAAAYCIYGQIASVVDWDLSKGRVVEIPVYNNNPSAVYQTGLVKDPLLGLVQSKVHPITQQNGAPWLQETYQPVTTPEGRPLTKLVTMGGPRIQFLTPFEYRREPGSSGMHSTKWVQRFRLIDYDDFIREYENLDGKTENFGKVEPENMSPYLQSFAMRHYLRLFQINPVYESNWRQSGSTFSDYLRKKILIIEHWDKPCERWPKGRRTVIANGFCTHISEPQYRTNKVGGWHPFTEAQWFKVAPSAIAKGPLHDVVEKNRQLNTADSLIATALQRNMGSKLLVKSGGGLDPSQITGTPGEVHECADPLNAAAYLHDNQPISPVIENLREQYKSDTYEESGAGDAIRGERSVGASSGYAHRLIQEREEKRITPNSATFERLISGTGEKLLYCIKANAVKLEDDVVGYLKTHSAGSYTVQDVAAFMESDFHLGSQIRVVSGSMQFRSKATQQANLMELAQKTPLGARLGQDADVMDKFLKIFDVEGLRDGSAAHRDKAQSENEIFEDLLQLGPDGKVQAMPFVLVEDDHDIHIASHTDWLVKNASEVTQRGWLFQALCTHLEQHRIQSNELAGKVPIGTSQYAQQTNQMSTAPNLQGVVAEKREMDAQKQNQAAQQVKAPPGSRIPAPIGSGGPPQESAGTAAQNTQTGRSQV